MYKWENCRGYMFILHATAVLSLCHTHAVQVLPCYGRSVLLRKYNVKENERMIFFASFLTPQKFLFEFRVTNEPNKTSIDGDAWKEYCRVYQLEMHQQVYFSIKKMGFDPSGAVCENLPIIHPCNILLS